MAPKQPREESRDAVPGPFHGQDTPLRAEKPHFRARTNSFFRSKHCLTLDTCSPLTEEKGRGRKNHPFLEQETSPRQDPATSCFGFHE